MKNLQAIKQRFGIIGRSAALDHALSTATRVANTDLTVLINGESGVGKEIFSKIIHSLSTRKHSNFIAINCGALPEGTINSELFGHEKGAFTGASTERKGYFESVDGGTIFLDEIGEMPLDTQAYLLRILETGEFLKVGSSKSQMTNVRVVAATNLDLEERVRKGKFREDLYYRLSTVPIRVPSLKERPEDISILFRKFAVDFAEKYRTTPIHLGEKAELMMENYGWPGNVRELKHITEQMSVLAEEKLITAEDLLGFIPNILKRNLPAMSNRNGSASEGLQEREILYNLLFEMKRDLTDLKSLVFELISNNDLTVSTGQLKQLQAPNYSSPHQSTDRFDRSNHDRYPSEEMGADHLGETESNKPIIIEHGGNSSYDKMEVVEENLSLEEMEKELIRKALKKHKGRRKDAADELGISERTLYRKIKHYEI
jgi:Transcriptional regulator containing GAF, AAA-type ATPase, and DNA binding domains